MKLRAVWGSGAAVAAAGLLACATNPATGDRQLSLVSEAQEIAMGREAAQQVEASIGLVDDASLQTYVRRIGSQLAAASERPTLPWTFGVVDDPTPNAFALPGGFIYVTRGLMNLMDSEAELASVVGHEIGHVTARHSVSMISRQQLAQLGLGLGGVLFPAIRPATQVFGAGLELLFLNYSRDAERQADDLGFRYAHAQGYRMAEMAEVFAVLQRAADMGQQSPLPNWLASHPAPAERMQSVRERIAALGGKEGTRVGRAEYLGEIDSLIFGANPRNGFFRENVFYHPDLRFRLALPQGWEKGNFARSVEAASGDGRALVRLTLAAAPTAAGAADRFFRESGAVSGGIERQTFGGIPAVVSEFQARAQGGTIVQGFAAFPEYGGKVYQILALADAAAFGAYRPVLAGVIASFAPVTDPRILDLEPKRIDVVRVPRDMTLASFNETQPSSVPIETLALVNQLSGPAAPLQGGLLVKRVVGGE